MCGILGFSKNLKIKKYDQLLNHRGPDGFDYKNFIISNFRLAIIDTDCKTSFPYEDNYLILSFNGEIYNYLSIKKELINKNYKFKTNTDTEVFAKAYIEWGNKCFKKMRGMFAALILIKKNNQLVLVRDTFGIKPIFYYLKNNKIIISSEIKSIKKIIRNQEINYNFIYNYLVNNNYCNNDETIFKDIKSVEPGNILTINQETFSIKFEKFVTINTNKKNVLDTNEVFEKFETLFKKAIQRCEVSDNHINYGSFLSGGLDSSLISLYSQKYNKKKPSFFFHHKCEDFNDDYSFAKRIASEANIKLSTSIMTKKDFPNLLNYLANVCDQPHGGLNDLSSQKSLNLAKKNNIKVIFSGVGSDEIQYGYDYYFKKIKSNIKSPIQGINNSTNNNLEKLFNWKNKKNISTEFKSPKQLMMQDLFGSKLRRGLLFGDHIAMDQSVEVRYPFLDIDLVNFCLSLDQKHHVKNKITKYLSKKLLMKNYPKLHLNLIKTKRSIQTSQTIWLKKYFFNYYMKQLCKNHFFKDNNFFNFKDIVNYLKKDKTKLNNSIILWKLICLNEWSKNL
jgi:asparagine synthase (glutamine-hydrolysing)